MNEIAYLRRIQQFLNEKNADTKDLVKVSKAFEDISILRKSASQMIRKTNKRTFELNKQEYNEKMQWINEYMSFKGMNEDIFTNINDYETSSDDYDYYYELKTPTQYKQEEEARKAKKLGTRPTNEGKEPGDE